METFESLIAANRRKSTLLVGGLMLAAMVIAGLLTAAAGAGDREMVAPLFLIGSSTGVLASFGGITWALWKGTDTLTSLVDAHQVQRDSDLELHNVVEEVAIAAGIPPPKVYLIQDASPNAFAAGPCPEKAIVAITTGLREKLTRDELQAVMAHEIAHIRNEDTRLMTLVAVTSGIIVLFADVFLRSLRHRRMGRSNRRSGGNDGAALLLILFVIGIVVALLAPLISRLLQLAVSREREYLADATAVEFTRHPLALVSALKKIAFDPDPLDVDNRAMEHMYIVNPNLRFRLARASIDSVWSTHPPLDKRIARLTQLAGAESIA